MGNATKVNLDRKSGMELRSWMTVNSDNFPASPTDKLSPNVMPCITLDLVFKTDSGKGRSLFRVQLPYTIAPLKEGKLNSNHPFACRFCLFKF